MNASRRRCGRRVQGLEWLICLIFAAIGLGAHAEVRLSSVFGDHMVLQRDQAVHVWGQAAANENGTATFRGRTASFQADALGRWSVYLPAGAAGGPFNLIMQARNRVELKDILVGDIWIASGQSNMAFPMSSNTLVHGPAEIAAANYPDIRLLMVNKSASDYPLEDADVTGWKPCSPDSVGAFSAVAYFFARELNQTQKIPIGVIESSWGGTPAEAWTSLDALTSDASLMPVFAARARMIDALSTTLRRNQVEEQINQNRQALGEGKLTLPWRPDPRSWAPAALFNAMIAPLTPLPIRGVIWYQGESNTDALRAPIYQRLFETLITDWRNQWRQEALPFLYVQISSFKSPDDWPAVREAQRKTLELRGTGMAVTVDINSGHHIHPPDKQDVGHRLALWARNLVYGEAIEDSGPLFAGAVPEGEEMVVAFRHAEGLHNQGANVEGFEVAGDDANFLQATARIEDQRVYASNPQIPHPHYVRYDWNSIPNGNLFNKDGLPASPFTSCCVQH